MSDSEEDTTQGKITPKMGTPKQQNRKRKFQDVEHQSPQGKKSNILSTPVVPTPKHDNVEKKKKQKGETPKQNFEAIKEKSKSQKNKKGNVNVEDVNDDEVEDTKPLNKEAKSKKNKKRRVDIEDDSNNDDDENAEQEDTTPLKKEVNSASKKKQLKSNNVKNSPKSSSNTENKKVAVSNDVARKDNRDSRTLFVKNLPSAANVKLIKTLSKDIKQVRIRTTFSVVNKKRLRVVYAYVEFSSEEIAEKNFKLLGETCIKGHKLMVDYVGSKSSFINKKLKTEPDVVDPQKLYITGLPESATEGEVRTLFPEATKITLPKRKKDRKLFGYGFIEFSSPDQTKKAHSNSQDLTLQGCQLVVLYAKKKSEQSDAKKRNRNKKAKNDAGSVAKKEVNIEEDEESSDVNEESDMEGEGDDSDDDDDDDDDE